jgi:hypothetical protein
MKKITFEIEFDDSMGYKGHGDDTAELIKNGLENFLDIDLVSDGVIKEGWTVTLKTNG